MGGHEAPGMLARGLRILVELGKHPDGLGLSDLARGVNLPVSTVHRLLVTHVSMGFVAFDRAAKRYRLGVRIFELSHRVGTVRSLSEAAVPAMRAVRESTGETVQLSVLDGVDVVFVERLDSDHAIAIRGKVGQRDPSFCTSTGKVLLSHLDREHLSEVTAQLDFSRGSERAVADVDALRAELDQVRHNGYAIADQEYDEGVRAIAVPIRDGAGAVVAALCVSAPTFRAAKEDLIGYLPVLTDAAREIGVRLPVTRATG